MIAEAKKIIHIRYFALLRERCGVSDETVKTAAATPWQLYQELAKRHTLNIPTETLRVAINDSFEPWDTLLKDQDKVVFIPPVAGG